MNGYISGRNAITMSEQCQLVDEVYETDENGVEKLTEAVKEIWCGRLSVSANEFYQAKVEGMKMELILAIHAIEYDGQEAVDFDGKKYAVKRVYERTDGLLELHCVKKLGVRHGSH